MSHPSTVQKVITAAQRTFQRSISNFVLNSEDFKESLVELKSILDSLRATDVGLDKSPILSQNPGQNQAKSGQNQASETPVTYIKIHEGKDVSIGIFLVKAGSRIPLHNHPKMYGLLKVLHGKVDVSIYTKTQKSQENIPQILVDKKHFIDQGFVFPTKKELLKSVTDEHEALVLTPEENNYHEIVTVGDGHAAFFDILAPPYHTEADSIKDQDEIRECHFFSEIHLASHAGHPGHHPGSGNNNIHSELSQQRRISSVWLRRIKSPEDYYCDTEPYLGPPLKLASVENSY